MVKFVGHYAPWLLPLPIGALVVVTLTADSSSSVPWPVVVVPLVVAGFLVLSLLAHTRRLCERCVAALPLDAAKVADRYGRRFRIAHLFESKLFALGYLVVVAGASFFYDDPIGKYPVAAIQASLAYLLFAYVTHQRLQPWCPHCKHGGEEQITPVTPTPVTVGA
jgi:hypothetical protein